MTPLELLEIAIGQQLNLQYQRKFPILVNSLINNINIRIHVNERYRKRTFHLTQAEMPTAKEIAPTATIGVFAESANLRATAAVEWFTGETFAWRYRRTCILY